MAVTFRSDASANGTSGTSITINKPTGAQSGDVLIAIFNIANYTPTVADNNGSYQFTSVYAAGFTVGKYFVFKRIAGASEPSTYNFTQDFSQKWSVVMLCYSGVDSSIFRIAPSSSTNANGNTNAPTAPAIPSGLTADDVAIAFTAWTNAYTPTSTPSGWTVRETVTTSRTLSVVEKTVTGTSQAAAAWAYSSETYWSANMFALKPAPEITRSRYFAAINQQLFGGV